MEIQLAALAAPEDGAEDAEVTGPARRMSKRLTDGALGPSCGH